MRGAAPHLVEWSFVLRVVVKNILLSSKCPPKCQKYFIEVTTKDAKSSAVEVDKIFEITFSK